MPEAWLFATETPDCWIDISSTLSRKVTARLANESQHTDPLELERNCGTGFGLALMLFALMQPLIGALVALLCCGAG